jgi:hypothetical protein
MTTTTTTTEPGGPPPPLSKAEFKAYRRRLLAELRKENASGPNRPLCRRCHFPILPGDAGELFPSRCASCSIRKVGEIIDRIVRNRGRRRTVRALKALAR